MPGAAKRIVGMAQAQSKHRRQLEKLVIESDIQKSWRGLNYGAGLAFTALVGGMVLIFCGHDAAGASVAGGTIVTLVGVFIYGTSTRRQERVDKAQQPPAGQQRRPRK